MPEKGYRIHLVGRISLQYYLITYCDRYYLLNYANPANPSVYGGGGAINKIKKWTIYDVDLEKNKFISMVNKYYLTGQQDNQCGWLMLISLILIPALVRNSNKNSMIHKFMEDHFLLNTGLIIVGLLIVVVLLNMYNKPKIDVSNYQKSILESVNIRPTIFGRAFAYLIISFSILFLLFISVFSCNIVALIIWGYVTFYYLFFNRFIVFMLDEKFHTSKRFKGKEFFKFIDKYLRMGVTMNLEPGDTYMLFKQIKK
ncbi:hypothetical protein [Bombilactobacillus thymidiniphilus]|uniref:Uncharacterized protein n=1 Tax=Bombilactobacillus thymidiniphilus TaxID=2923363 RepID=A0ABY4PEN7_9LACO|nr:hypothetical protein [Bombilactobacillus thymidiniphilus]UQS84100.1 hypothetical protein MOO47_02810 [Bombilactobacillus thymidiniphilus]